MVSDMLRLHPEITSISEFFSLVTDLGGRIGESFPEGLVSAEQFRGIVAGIHPKQATLMRHGVGMDEVLYRPGRFTDGVPAILQTVLPHLWAEPDAVYDEIVGWIAAQDPAPIATWYRRLFARLAERHGRSLGRRSQADSSSWVERSGGSLRVVARLQRAFPDAKFVHVVRDGRDCAMSMSRHPGFRMALIAAQLTEILGVDPYESADRSNEGDLPDELLPFLPERFDRAAFVRFETPLPLCGHYWSGECAAGLRELAEIPASQRLVLRYEDFLGSPEPTLRRLGEFLDCPSDDWVRRGSALVRPPRSRWQHLPAPILRELESACRPGFEALAPLYVA